MKKGDHLKAPILRPTLTRPAQQTLVDRRKSMAYNGMGPALGAFNDSFVRFK